MAPLELPFEIVVEIFSTGHLDTSKSLYSSIMLNKSLWSLVVRQLIAAELISDVAPSVSSMSINELIKCATRKFRIAHAVYHPSTSLPRIKRHDVILTIPHPSSSDSLSTSSTLHHSVTPTLADTNLITGGRWLVAVCCTDKARYLACWDLHPNKGDISIIPGSTGSNSPLPTPILPTSLITLDNSEDNDPFMMGYTLCDSRWCADQNVLSVLLRGPEDLVELFQWNCTPGEAFVRSTSTLTVPGLTLARLARIGNQAFVHTNHGFSALWNWHTPVVAADIRARLRDGQQYHQFTASGVPFRIATSLDTDTRLSIKFAPLRMSRDNLTRHSDGMLEAPILSHFGNPTEITYMFDEPSADKLYVSWFPATRLSSEEIILCFRVHYSSSPLLFFLVSNDVRPELLFVTNTYEDPLPDRLAGFWINRNWTFAFSTLGKQRSKQQVQVSDENSRAGRSSAWQAVHALANFALPNSAIERASRDIIGQVQPLLGAFDEDTDYEHIVTLRPFGLVKRIASFPARSDDAGTRIARCEGFCARSGSLIFRKQWADDSESLVILMYD
ncbi:hypothetical protein DL93DRAFT_2169434 [Clavulina sp. PMI_390]|nr:hypothetical protein DL93DRAFT_2169434 [Clavulina sp. PMI_390]